LTPLKIYTKILKVYKGAAMTSATNYKRELYSLPLDVVNDLKQFASQTNQKKSHIVARAIEEYIHNQEQGQLKKDALKLIGIINANTKNIQELKAQKND